MSDSTDRAAAPAPGGQVALPAPVADLESMTEAQLTSYFAKANAAFGDAAAFAAAAADTADDASEELAAVLTERLARRVLHEAPGADLLVLTPVPSDCRDEDGASLACSCEGSLGLQVLSVLSADGTEHRVPDAMSPVHFLVELLSDHLDCDDEIVLELATRDWGVRCPPTCPDGCAGTH